MTGERLGIDEYVQMLDAEILWREQNPDKAFHAEYRKGFVNGLIQAKYLINGAEKMLGDRDPERYITEDGKCSGCGEQLDFDNMSAFEVEESGVQPGTEHGPAVHWAFGVWICPNCQDRLPFETSS